MHKMLPYAIVFAAGYIAAYVTEIIDVVRNLFRPKGGN